jgi:hypothetical protein
MPKKSKRRGRPPAGETTLTERVMVRATPDQVLEWAEAAEAAGFTYNGKPNIGGWLRSLAVEAFDAGDYA